MASEILPVHVIQKNPSGAIFLLKFNLGSIYAIYSRMQGADAAHEANPRNSWDQVFQEALDYAQLQVSPLYWRGTLGGVLPHGYDPNSIAAQAILDTLKSLPPHAEPDNLDTLAQEIHRRVRQHVNRLHHLKEDFVTRNELDLALVFTDDGEAVRLIDTLVSPDTNPLEDLLNHERRAEWELFQARFKSFLGRQRRLKRLFACYCAGLEKPVDLARRLKIKVQAVYNLQKALRRRLTQFCTSRTSAAT
ncbi:MAG TPA: hypothetical protein VNZ64_14230 [Candidatus Acidoferrum sp.]|jgi:hypothetical protein|nr:hypothetical protein [Candidatus Acidoferrum sp.]